MKVQPTIDVMPGIALLVIIGGVFLYLMFSVYPVFSFVVATAGIAVFLYYALRDDPPDASKDRT